MGWKPHISSTSPPRDKTRKPLFWRPSVENDGQEVMELNDMRIQQKQPAELPTTHAPGAAANAGALPPLSRAVASWWAPQVARCSSLSHTHERALSLTPLSLTHTRTLAVLSLAHERFGLSTAPTWLSCSVICVVFRLIMLVLLLFRREIPGGA